MYLEQTPVSSARRVFESVVEGNFDLLNALRNLNAWSTIAATLESSLESGGLKVVCPAEVLEQLFEEQFARRYGQKIVARPWPMPTCSSVNP